MSNNSNKTWRWLLLSGALTGLVLCYFVLPLTTVNAAAGINQQLNFQGRLLNSSGATVTDGVYNIEFKIYQDGDGQSVGDTTGSPAGALKWHEDHLVSTSTGVTVKNGYLSVQLGSVTPFGSSVDWNQDTLWLSVDIGNTTSCTVSTTFDLNCGGDGEMTPMKRLSSNTYAFNSGLLGGLASTQYVQLAQGLQVDAGNSVNSIYINKTGTGGNFIDLQAGGTDAFTLSNSGNVTFGNNADHTISVTTAGSGVAGKSLTISAGTAGTGGSALAGGNLVLQGGTGGGTNGNGGNITIDAGAPNGTGSGGTVSIGATNASTVNVATNNASHTIAIGTGTSGIQGITIGSTSSSSSLTLSAGSAGISLNGATSVSGANTFSTGTGTVTIQGVTTVSANLTFTNAVNVAFQKGADYSTTGPQNDVNLGTGVVIRLTGASAQTINGIAGGANGRVLTLVNAASQAATLSYLNVGSAAANQINTGTGSDLAIPAGGAVSLVYDSSASLWRVVGSSSSTGGYVQLQGATPGTRQTGNINVSGSILASAFDVDSALTTTLAIGTSNATTINIGTNNANHTIAIGNGTGIQTVTLGSTNSSSTTTIQAGSGGIVLSGATSLSGASTFSSGTGAISLQGVTTVSANLIVTNAANVAFQRGTDISTTAMNDFNFGTSSLVRLSGSSTQTITGLANGADGRLLTIVNAGTQAAVISNQSASSTTATNRIITGTGGDISLPIDASITLVYDSGATRWRVVGSTAATGGYIQLQGSTPGAQQSGNFNISGTGILSTLASATSAALTITGNAASTWSTSAGLLTVQGAGGVTVQSAGGTTSSNVTIASGNASAGVSGTIGIDNGTSTSGTPTINLGIANARTIQIGNTANNVTQTIGVGNLNTTGTTNVTVGTGSSATGGTTTVQAKGTLTLTGTGGITATGAAASSLTTSSGALTVTSAAAATWSTGAGLLTVQGAGGVTVQSAAGTTSSDVTIATGNASAGVSGNISIDNGTLTSGSPGINIGTTNARSIQLGNTANNITQAINIGNLNTTGTTNVTVGTGSSATGGSTTVQAKGTLTLTGTGGITATGAAASSLTTSSGALTVTSAAAATWSTGAGLLTVQGAGGITVQSAAGTTSSNVTITSGNASAGVSGTISIDNGTFTSGTPTITLGTTSARSVQIGNSTSTTTVSIEAGTATGSLAIGNGATAHNIQIGTGAAAQTITLGSTNGTSQTTIQAGSNGIVLGAATTAQANLTVTNAGSLATQRGTDVSTATLNDANLGTSSLVRLTGTSTQTLTGISGGVDGRILTIVNAGTQAAVISNQSASSVTAANRIITGTGGDISLPIDASITLVYDSGATRWRVVGSSSATGGYVQLQGTSPGTRQTGNINVSGSILASAFDVDSALTTTLGIGNTNAATINIGANALAHTINIGSDTTTVQGLLIGSSNGGSSTAIKAGTGGLTIQSQGGTLGIGNNNIAQTLVIGNNNSAGSGTSVTVFCGSATCSFGGGGDHTTNIGTNGSAGSANQTNIQGGTGGINIGVGGIANNIQVGNTSGAVAQTIQIGTNATGSSSTAITIGSTVAGNITLQSAATINIGQNSAAQTINLGNAVSGTLMTVEAGTGTTALFNGNTAHTVQLGTGGTSTAQAITIGSATNTTSTLTLQGGNGASAIVLQTGNNTTTTAGGIQIGNTTGAFSQTINIGTNATAGSTTNITIGNGSTTTAGTTTLQAKTNVVFTTNSVVRGTFGTANDFYFGNGVSASAPNNFTIQGTASSTTAVAGGSITLQGGNATTGSANGGTLTLSGGTGVGTGVNGLVVLTTPTFQTAGTQTCSASCNITQANIDSNGSVVITVNTTTGAIVSMPNPTISGSSAYGRVVYVTAASGSLDFTLRVNGGGAGNDIAMRSNTTATMVWGPGSGSGAWTAAGASSSTTLQAAYDNTLTSAGGAELVLSKTSNHDGLTIRDSSSSAVNGTLLEVQTANASTLFSVNGAVTDYATNGGAETQGASSSTFPASTWGNFGSGTATRSTSSTTIATGQASVSVVTTAASSGTKNTLTGALTANLNYNVSFTALLSSGTFNTMNVYYSVDGTAQSVACVQNQAIATSIWTKVNCVFTAPSSGITGTNAILIFQSAADSTARTFYIDNLSVTISASQNYATDGGVDDNTNFATNWPGVGVSSTRSTTFGNDTSDSAQVTTTTSSQGLRNKLSINPLQSTLYRISVYASASSSFSTFQIRYSPDNGTTFIPCADYNTTNVSSPQSTFQQITCYIQTTNAAITTPYVYFTQTDTTGRTINIDTFSMTISSNAVPNVQIGGGVFGGPTTLLTLDKAASAPIAANNASLLGSMYYDTTLGKLQCYEADGWGACGSSPDNIITISPEYTNAVLHGTGVGTMTSDICSDFLDINDAAHGTPVCGTNETYNFYKWTSPQSTSQTYSIYVTYQLPSTFKSFTSGSTSVKGRTDSTNATVQYGVYKSNSSGMALCGTVSVSTGSVSSWQPGVASGTADPSTCGFAPGDSLVFKIDVTASSNADAYVSNLGFTYSNK